MNYVDAKTSRAFQEGCVVMQWMCFIHVRARTGTHGCNASIRGRTSCCPIDGPRSQEFFVFR